MLVPRLFPYACIHGVLEVRRPRVNQMIGEMILNEFSLRENSRLGFVNELLMENGGQLWGEEGELTRLWPSDGYVPRANLNK